VIARAFAAGKLAVDTSVFEPRGDARAQQQVVDAQALA
jgi:hypothetical protein